MGGWSRRTENDTKVTALLSDDVVPFCQHALIFSRAGAQRVNKIEAFLHARRRPDAALTGNADPCMACYEIKGDSLMIAIAETFLSRSERHTWVAFESPELEPARWKGASWTQTQNRVWNPSNLDKCDRLVSYKLCEKRGRGCDALPPRKDWPAEEKLWPLFGTGLVFQHTCKMKALPEGFSSGEELLNFLIS